MKTMLMLITTTAVLAIINRGGDFILYSATARQNESIDDIFLENELERELKEQKSSISTDIILDMKIQSFRFTGL